MASSSFPLMCKWLALFLQGCVDSKRECLCCFDRVFVLLSWSVCITLIECLCYVNSVCIESVCVTLVECVNLL